METFDYGVLGTLVVVVVGMIGILYDLRHGGKLLGLANTTLDKIEKSPALDGLEWLGKEVIPVEVLNKFHDGLEKARLDSKEAYLEVRAALDSMHALSERLLGLLEKVTDGKPNNPNDPEELLRALKAAAKPFNVDVREVEKPT